MKTKNGLIYTSTTVASPNWNAYHRETAKVLMFKFGEIFIDRHGFPIDRDSDIKEIERHLADRNRWH